MKTMMKVVRAAVFAAAVLAAPAAFAQDAAIEAAKVQGVIGEMYTGYLGVADPSRVTPDLQRRIDEINAKRLAVYTQLAEREGQSVATIAALTAEKQIARAQAGEPVKPGASDGWMRK